MIYPDKSGDEALYWFKKTGSNITEVNPFSCFTKVESSDLRERELYCTPTSLFERIDTNGNGRIDQDEIEKAVKKSPARFYLRFGACKHTSDWYFDPQKWEVLRTATKPFNLGPQDKYDAFLEIDQKMTFLHKVDGFSQGEELCHFHPIAFVEHLKKLSPLGWPLDRNKIRKGLNCHTFGRVRSTGSGIHQGWDFEAVPGTPTYAVSNGTVVNVRHQYTSEVGYGKQIILSFHLNGKEYFAHYAHLDDIDVTEGQKVLIGQKIGQTGNTGNAYNMVGLDQHLHFEIRTKHFPGGLLNDRISPYEIYKFCPLKTAVNR